MTSPQKEETKLNKKEEVKKCSHGKRALFCCECRYGKIREESDYSHDVTDDIRRDNGYKLLKGHMGDISVE